MRESMNYSKVPINGINDFTGHSFDTAAHADLFYGNKEVPQALKGWKGVFNVDTGKIASVVTDGYQIIQHNDTVTAVKNVLGRLNLDVKGLAKDYRDRYVADLVFQNAGVEVKDDATGIQIGIRVVNSYNKQTSFRLEMFGFRRVCQNGMTFGAQSFGVVENTIHYGSKEKGLAEIERLTNSFVKRVIGSSEIMQNYVNQMIGDSLEYEQAVKIVQGLIRAKKHQDWIINSLEGCKSRWDLYNAITDYATHGEQLTPSVETYLENRSRKIMETPGEALKVEAEKMLSKEDIHN